MKSQLIESAILKHFANTGWFTTTHVMAHISFMLEVSKLHINISHVHTALRSIANDRNVKYQCAKNGLRRSEPQRHNIIK